MSIELDIQDIKGQFPVFEKYPELVYLDNAATTQRPATVIDALADFHVAGNANIHRGVYHLSSKATSSYERARKAAADFIGADSAGSVAFTNGTTESINIVASSFLKDRLKPGDNVVVSVMEHHANFIPWQMVCKACNAELRVIPIDDKGDLLTEQLDKLIDSKTKLVALTHISNTLGTVNDISPAIKLARKFNATVLVDAAQSAALYTLDVQHMDCDFLTFSAHKAFGPFGLGILYVKPEHREYIHPYNYGGGIVQNVGIENTEFMAYPTVLEAGTPNISGAVGLEAALTFIKTLDLTQLNQHLNEITDKCRQELNAIEGVTVVGNPKRYSSIVSFMVEDIHPHDVASFLNEDHTAVRAGMHCTQPLLNHMQVPATVRASFSIYNDMGDVEKLIAAVKDLIKFWQ